MKKADDASLYFQYARAVPLLEKVIAKDNKYKSRAQVLLARCHMHMNNMEKAGEVYAQVIGSPGIDPVNHYYYGQVLRTLGNYEMASKQFMIYDSWHRRISVENCLQLIVIRWLSGVLIRLRETLPMPRL